MTKEEIEKTKVGLLKVYRAVVKENKLVEFQQNFDDVLEYLKCNFKDLMILNKAGRLINVLETVEFAKFLYQFTLLVETYGPEVSAILLRSLDRNE